MDKNTFSVLLKFCIFIIYDNVIFKNISQNFLFNKYSTISKVNGERIMTLNRRVNHPFRYLFLEKKKSLIKVILTLLILTLLLLMATSVSAQTESEPINAYSVEIDGTISDNEYDSSAEFRSGDYKLYWSVVGDEIHFAIICETTGWVALGIDPDSGKIGADMIIGWVTDTGEVEIFDTYSKSESSHPRDTDLGGTFDISEYAGTQTSTHTIIEFKRPLSTGDQYDKAIPAEGSIKIIWAFGSSDSFSKKHKAAGFGTISTKRSTETIEDEPGGICLGTALISLFSAATLVSFCLMRYWKKNT